MKPLLFIAASVCLFIHAYQASSWPWCAAALLVLGIALDGAKPIAWRMP